MKIKLKHKMPKVPINLKTYLELYFAGGAGKTTLKDIAKLYGLPYNKVIRVFSKLVDVKIKKFREKKNNRK